jgi:hypothetical protein
MPLLFGQLRVQFRPAHLSRQAGLEVTEEVSRDQVGKAHSRHICRSTETCLLGAATRCERRRELPVAKEVLCEETADA